MSKVDLVSLYKPREWARELHSLDKRYLTLVIHRGAGKSIWAINHLIMKAFQATDPLATFVYLSPHKSQSKRNIWDKLKHYLSHIPHNMMYFNEAELRVVLPNGASIILLGANEPDSLRGMHIAGAVLDEVAQMPHNTWSEVIYPTLQARRGWCVFIGTPKGKNLFYDLYQNPMIQPEHIAKNWHSVLRTVYNTNVFTPSQIEEHKATAGDEAFEQEYLCSFTAAIKGAFYGRSLEDLRAKGQITKDIYDPSLPVYTSWDLGSTDSTAIWFAQCKNGNVNIIDFFEDDGVSDLQYYIDILKSKSYTYKMSFLPHDAAHRISGMASTRYQQIKAAGFKVRVLPKLSVIEGINAVRSLLPKCNFDEPMVDYGLKCLMHYRAKYNERMGVMMAGAVHDWASHAADSFRYLAMGLKNESIDPNSIRISSDYNLFQPEQSPDYSDYDVLNT